MNAEQARVALLKARAAKEQAEADKLAAEARRAELDIRKEIINVEREEQKRKEELAANKYFFVYTFSGQVDSSSVKGCMEQLNIWHRNHPDCEIEIVFHSPGGSVIDGMALFDFIQGLRAQHKITTTTLGMAASMAGILLQAGEKRVMGREAYVLIHEISTAMIGKIGEIEDEVKFCKKIQKRIVDIFVQRSQGKISKRTFERNWRRKDWWLDSDEAKKLGFIDEVR